MTDLEDRLRRDLTTVAERVRPEDIRGPRPLPPRRVPRAARWLAPAGAVSRHRAVVALSSSSLPPGTASDDHQPERTTSPLAPTTRQRPACRGSTSWSTTPFVRLEDPYDRRGTRFGDRQDTGEGAGADAVLAAAAPTAPGSARRLTIAPIVITEMGGSAPTAAGRFFLRPAGRRRSLGHRAATAHQLAEGTVGRLRGHLPRRHPARDRREQDCCGRVPLLRRPRDHDRDRRGADVDDHGQRRAVPAVVGRELARRVRVAEQQQDAGPARCAPRYRLLDVSGNGGDLLSGPIIATPRPVATGAMPDRAFHRRTAAGSVTIDDTSTPDGPRNPIPWSAKVGRARTRGPASCCACSPPRR